MWDSLVRAGPGRAAEFYRRGWWRRDTFLDDLRRNARGRPDAAAVVAYRNGRHARTLTYRELARCVDRFAAALAELGVGAGDAVVVHLPNWWMLTPLYLACARAGAVVASVIPPFGGRELAYVLTVTAAKVCVVPDSYAGIDYARRLAEVAPKTLEHRVVAGDAAATGAVDFTKFFVDTAWEQRNSAAERPLPAADDVAQVVFTSGTTGKPKGVVHTFNTLYAAGRTFSDVYRLGPDDLISAASYLAHLAGTVYVAYLPVTLGAACVMQDTFDMGLLLDLAAAHGVTLVLAAPRYLTRMVAAQRENPRHIPALRFLNVTGAPIPPRLVAEAREVFGLRLDAHFGMSECGGITITRPEDPDGWAACSDGSPVDWAEIRIDAPPGERSGQLLIRGASLCLGYLGQREAFLACLDDDGWFDTGDTARDDGRGGIRITGRRADLIVRSNGLMVPVLEVEAILADHPAITDAVLIGYQDPEVPGTELACAVVVPDGTPPRLAEVTKFLEEHGVGSRDLPDRLEVRRELPTNAQGKILRSVLRRQLDQEPQC
jgi:cyclohexanecarboxylate-CoA ligase